MIRKKCLQLLFWGSLSYDVALASNPRVEIRTTAGTMIAELFPEKAPKTVENFLRYIHNGFYNGTTFHRTVAGFVIQGGGFTADFQLKPTNPPIVNEADNGLKNIKGTLAMARDYAADSATSQFFINLECNKHLNFYKAEPGYMGYTVFGALIEGYTVAEKISERPTKTVGVFNHVPAEPIIIESITLLPVAEIEQKTAAPPAVLKKKRTERHRSRLHQPR